MIQSINRNRPPDEITQQTSLSRLIAEQQNAIATGKRINRPSDDPQGWLEVAALARFQSDEQAWTNNIGRAETRASQAEASLTAITNGLIRARELMVQGASDTVSQADRDILANEIEAIAADFAGLLDQRDTYGGPLFSAGPPIAVPVSVDRNVVAAPALAAVSTGIAVGGGVTASLDTIMADTVAALRTGTGADRAAQLDALAGAVDHMSGEIANIGVARGALQAARDQLDSSSLALTERRAALEQTNVSEAIVQLQSLLTNLQAAQAIYGRVSQQTLLDYLG